MNFASNLREVRQARKLSIPALSRKTGIGRSQLYKYERGASIPRYSALIRLTEALGVSSDRLLGRLRLKVKDIPDKRLMALLRGFQSLDSASIDALESVLEFLQKGIDTHL